ncbi:MAG: tetratricopeptide repeat protein [Candidatus Atribacteria bacterium]|nr:tetratricopeptide repeat protein [Candidatus Atribacteria bacterium]
METYINREYIINQTENRPLFEILGFVYTELKEYQEAIKFYQKAIVLDSSHEDATYNLDIVYKMLKLQQKGIENMKKICPLCGTENEEDARFCKECNEPLYDPYIYGNLENPYTKTKKGKRDTSFPGSKKS